MQTKQFAEAVAKIRDTLSTEAAKLTAHIAAKEQDIRAALLQSLTQQEGRAIKWRCRLRLYTVTDGFNNPIADSIGSDDPIKPGDEVLPTLPAVVTWMAELAENYHKTTCFGLSEITLRRKLGKVYNQLTLRGDGQAVLLSDYLANNSRFRARVDLLREDLLPAMVGVGDGAGSDFKKAAIERLSSHAPAVRPHQLAREQK